MRGAGPVALKGWVDASCGACGGEGQAAKVDVRLCAKYRDWEGAPDGDGGLGQRGPGEVEGTGRREGAVSKEEEGVSWAFAVGR